MKRLFSLLIIGSAFLFGPTLSAQDQGIRRIEVGTLSTTHILFTSDLTYVDLSIPQLFLAKVVDASKNMLAIKASQPFDCETTISALEANGTMHTFYVTYNDKPAELIVDTRNNARAVSGQVNTQIRSKEQHREDVVLEQPSDAPDSSVVSVEKKPTKKERPAKKSPKAKKQKDSRKGGLTLPRSSTASGVNVSSDQTSNFGRHNAPTIGEILNCPRDIYHIYDKTYKISAAVTNIFAYSDLTYIVIELYNNSDIGYEAGNAQFQVENRRNSSKSLASDKPISPKSSYGTLSCPPKGTARIGFTLPKQTLQKNEVVRLYIYEKNGNRNLFLTLDDKDLNLAVSPFTAVSDAQ